MASVQCKHDGAADTGLRARLLEQAVAMVDSGAGEPTLRAVARAAGVSAMAPYRHFADHAALLGAVAAVGFDDLHAVLAAADAGAQGGAAVIAQGEAYVAFAVRRPALFRLMFAGHVAPVKPVAAQASGNRGDAYAVLADRVAALWPDQADIATLGCWAIVHGLATLTLDSRLSPGQDRVGDVLAVFVAGLGRIHDDR